MPSLLHNLIINDINDCIMKPNSQFAYHAGPPLLLPALSYTLLFAASLLSGALLRHGAPFVNPYGPAEAAQAFFAQNFAATRWSAFFFFGSSVPLAIYTATVVSRLRPWECGRREHTLRWRAAW